MKKFKNLDSILLIDNDRFINVIHSKAVLKAGLGVDVRAVTTVEEALSFLTASGSYEATPHIPRPGIIFLDINMPSLSGWDFMDSYHKLEASFKAKIIVVLLTTFLNSDDHKRALSDKAISALLRKPLQPNMVIDLAERYFETNDEP